MRGELDLQEETTSLLDPTQSLECENNRPRTRRPLTLNNSHSQKLTVNPFSVLPIAFLTALGMAATATTSIYAYASLLCKNPTHCQKSERNLYAGSVALAVSIANLCSLLALGPLEKLSRTHRKLGLVLWILCRSMSVVMLALGVYLNSILVALSGRIFEGLASDNLLHFNLNIIFVHAPDKAQVSRFIGASLALFMVGISISPAVAGLFRNFTTSFIMALGILGLALFYLVVLIRPKNIPESKRPQSRHATPAPPLQSNEGPENSKASGISWSSPVKRIFAPLQLFFKRPTSFLSSVTLFIYNAVQSYIFSLIMVHTSLLFGFSSKQNGILLSMVHAISASYLFFVLFAVPRLIRTSRRHERNETDAYSNQIGGTMNAVLCLVSLTVQTIALVGFANATESWQIYAASALVALGLATPSFIKSHFLGFFSEADAGKAVGALTMMETFGSLLSPVFLGAWQSIWPGNGVFFAAAGMMIVAIITFGIASFALVASTSEEIDEIHNV